MYKKKFVKEVLNNSVRFWVNVIKSEFDFKIILLNFVKSAYFIRWDVEIYS